ncbi:hypothetical protein GCM10010869_65080 [Mesorhizobium tianshanense]|nr:hypothetical protein GCM10010869_65080 [Mesorhizobium tianshanense]
MMIERAQDELPPLPIGASGPTHAFVILGRSKERSDAAQTLGSMPLPPNSATVRNNAPDPKRISAVETRVADILNRLGLSTNVTAWILGSTHAASRRLRPRMTKARSPSRVTQSVRQSGEAC